ncbi:alpha/beta hydrolase [Wukongibacter baidiensis]|uniref:alpha/beta hydrolase n=1 Tax=Wukongibacter baidiensis TaxID=1723361 RepID=UPI003D7F9493
MNTDIQPLKKYLKMCLRTKKIRNLLVCIVIGLVILMFLVPPIIVYFATQQHVNYLGSSEEHPLQDIYRSQDFGLEAKEMKLTTEDGLKVWASEVFIDNPKAVIIYLSGIQQPSVTYFYGHSKWMKNNGYATILLEVRGHGNSEGNSICLGYDEVSDVKAVVDYIRGQEKYDSVPIILHGVSMGGSVAINSFGCIKEIDGLIAMSAYSSFEDVVCDQLNGSYKIPRFICKVEKLIVRASLQFLFGDKVNEITPIKQIKNVGSRPVLLIASSGDTEVPPINMQRILGQAPKNCESWLRNSSEHFIIQESDFMNMEKDREYCDRILTFIETKVVGQVAN